MIKEQSTFTIDTATAQVLLQHALGGSVFFRFLYENGDFELAFGRDEAEPAQPFELVLQTAASFRLADLPVESGADHPRVGRVLAAGYNLDRTVVDVELTADHLTLDFDAGRRVVFPRRAEWAATFDEETWLISTEQDEDVFWSLTCQANGELQLSLDSAAAVQLEASLKLSLGNV